MIKLGTCLALQPNFQPTKITFHNQIVSKVIIKDSITRLLAADHDWRLVYEAT